MKNNKSSGYDVAVGPCRFFLQLLGTWPDPYVERNWFCHVRISIVVSVMVFFATITQTVKNIQVWGDLNAVTEIFINSEVSTSTAVVKVFSVWYYSRALRELMRQISEDWQSPHDVVAHQIMEDNAKFSRLVTATCIFLSVATFVAQALLAFLTIGAHAKDLQNQNWTTEWPLYMKASFPYDVQRSPNYELSLIGQTFSNFFAATTYTSTDSLFVILILHLCGQLSILRLELRNLSGKLDQKEFLEKIKYIHNRYNELASFSSAVEEIFNKTFLVQMLTSSFVLCMLGYQFITITSGNNIPFMELIFLIYYIVCFLFITFTYCYMAEKLREKSSDISDAAYECNWIDLPYQQSKLLIIVMVRAKQPFEITAGKFVSFSLVLYCRILKSSGGYMSMLLAIQQRLTAPDK